VLLLLIKPRENGRNGCMFCYKKWDEIIAKDWREDVKNMVYMVQSLSMMVKK